MNFIFFRKMQVYRYKVIVSEYELYDQVASQQPVYQNLNDQTILFEIGFFVQKN